MFDHMVSKVCDPAECNNYYCSSRAEVVTVWQYYH